MMEPHSARFTRTRLVPEPSVTPRRPDARGGFFAEVALTAGLLVGAMVAAGCATAGIGLGFANVSGILLLMVAKFGAVLTLRASRGVVAPESASERSAAFEALTMGSLLAFVGSLALGGAVSLPRAFLVADWAATIAAVALVRVRPRGQAGVCEPEVASAFRDRVFVVSHALRRPARRLRRELISLGAREGCTLGGPTARPDVVVRVLGADAPSATALATRRLIREALGRRVGTFVLVTWGPFGPGLTLSEKIVEALAGLTRSRLIRIRVDPALPLAQATRRILRLAARGRDGAAIHLGGSGGACETRMSQERDSAALWAALDRIQARSCPE